jgi:hypothetical protein
MFTTTGSAGQLGALVPFAEAIGRAGGEVLIVTREFSAERVRAAGFDVWPFAEAPAPLRNPDRRRLAAANLGLAQVSVAITQFAVDYRVRAAKDAAQRDDVFPACTGP